MNCTVRFQPSGREVRVPAGTPLLEAVREAGLPVASACGESQVCALCGLEILEGEDTLPPESENEVLIKKLNRVDAYLRLSCRLQVQGDLVVSAHYW